MGCAKMTRRSLSEGDPALIPLRQSSVPLWVRIERSLRQMLLSETYPIGSQLPSEPALAATFGVSRMTVRQAVQRLVSEGHLTRGRGRGTFVTRPPVRREVSTQYLDGFFATLTGRGHQVETQVLNLRQEPADHRVASALQLTTGTHVYRLERLRFVDGEPVSIQTSYLPVLLVLGLEQYDFTTVSLYEVLSKRLGLAVLAIDQTISALTANPNHAHLLRLPVGSALLHVDKVARTDNDTPLEFGQLLFNPSAYQLTMSIRS
jgi:GntR family transcriptional regulator